MSDDIFYKFIYLFDPPKKSQTNIFEYIDQIARAQHPRTQPYIDHPTNEYFYDALRQIMEECIQQERSKVAGSSGKKEAESNAAQPIQSSEQRPASSESKSEPPAAQPIESKPTQPIQSSEPNAAQLTASSQPNPETLAPTLESKTPVANGNKIDLLRQNLLNAGFIKT